MEQTNLFVNCAAASSHVNLLSNADNVLRLVVKIVFACLDTIETPMAPVFRFTDAPLLMKQKIFADCQSFLDLVLEIFPDFISII